jgi:predicted N-formylglutamate amidohydrolase
LLAFERSFKTDHQQFVLRCQCIFYMGIKISTVKTNIHSMTSKVEKNVNHEHRLLQASDPQPVGQERLGGNSRFLLIADHAGNAVPQRLGDLGISATELNRHIGIDIGIHGVSQRLSGLLDAPYVFQRYSRLVIDCNRQLGNATSVSPVSDGTHIPANQDLDREAIARRQDEIFWPYQNAIAQQIEAMRAANNPPVVIAMHSFTPKHGDYPAPRPWQIGVLFNRDDRLARSLIAQLDNEGDLTVGINQPYAVGDNIDYAVPIHCENGGLLHVELEIRQDLIGTSEGQTAWAERLARLLPMALDAAEQQTNKKAL